MTGNSRLGMGHFLRPIFVAAKVVTKREQLRLKNESKRKHKGDEGDDDKENEDRPSKARKSSGSSKGSRKGKGKGRGRGGKVSKRKQGKGDPHNEAENKEAEDVMDEVGKNISELKLDEGSHAENSNAKNDDPSTAIPSVTKKKRQPKLSQRTLPSVKVALRQQSQKRRSIPTKRSLLKKMMFPHRLQNPAQVSRPKSPRKGAAMRIA